MKAFLVSIDILKLTYLSNDMCGLDFILFQFKDEMKSDLIFYEDFP